MKSEFSQSFSLLGALVLLGTGCVQQGKVSSGKPAPGAAGKTALTGNPTILTVANDPASGSGPAIAAPAKTQTGGTLMANAASSEVGTIVTASPPLPQVEVVGAPPNSDYAWMPGVWTWRGSWVWISGRWVLRPRPEARWIPGHWTEHRNGWVWIHGYWR